MILLRPVVVSGLREPLHQRFLIEPVGLHEIIERIAMVAQFGIHEPQKQVRVHLEIAAKIHGRKLAEKAAAGK